MVRRLQERLQEGAGAGFVGRSKEMATLLGELEPGGHPVVHLHGIAGVGKTTLLGALCDQARAHGASVIRLDGRTVEPTPSGFLRELGAAIGADTPGVEDVASRLSGLGERVVLALDAYELFRMLDTWLRQVFLPALDDNVRVVLCGREPPVSAWLNAPEWQGLFRTLRLGPLADEEALELMARSGVREEEARHINRFARGHPLALRLAAAALGERPDASLDAEAMHPVIEELARRFLSDVQDPLTRRALEAASVVRRATVPLLGAMLPQAAPQDSYERLRALPFVESARDGLLLHEAVQQAIAAALKAADPVAYRDYRRAAWRHLRREFAAAPRAETWRYTADLLYMLENPIIREAFFPSGAPQFALEPARPEDGPAIQTIIERHEGPQAAAALLSLRSALPQSFFVARERGEVAGFYILFDPYSVRPAAFEDDPVCRRWWRHLREDPMPRGSRVLFNRRTLAAEHGEGLSAVQAACWRDIKRTQFELRPHMRRLYGSICDLPTFGPILQGLGFRPAPETDIHLDGVTYHTGLLDFGPGSVDAWLAGLVAAELGLDGDELLDPEARQLVLDGDRVPLTRLEFEVMSYLYQRERKAVSRAALLQDVWGYDYEGGSNVVDVVIRSLRKKLGERAPLIETVTGVGYRFRR